MKKFFFTINKILSFAFILSLVLFVLIPLSAASESEESSINIGVTIGGGGSAPEYFCGDGEVNPGESCDDGLENHGACPRACSLTCTINNCGGSGGGDSWGPAISIVSSTVSDHHFYLSWLLSDISGISTTSLAYGIGNYDHNAVVTVLDDNIFAAEVVDLAAATDYQYRITAVDANIIPNTAYQSGNLRTLPIIVPMAPLAINEITIATDATTAHISFRTNRPTVTQILYRLPNQPEITTSDALLADNHNLLLTNLLPDQLYFFRIVVTDVDLNSTEVNNLSFRTLSDNIPPPNVTDLQITTSANAFTLSWRNPSLAVAPDFVGVKILRTTNHPASGPNDVSATLTHVTTSQSFVDNEVVPAVNYYYTVFSFDTSGNYSSGVYKNGSLIFTPPPVGRENCLNGIDDDGDGQIDCADHDCTEECEFLPPNEPACSNGIDDDDDGLIDFPNDPGCLAINDADEYNSPTSSVPDFAKIDFNQLLFLGGNRLISLHGYNHTVNSLAESSFTIGVPQSALLTTPTKMILKINDQNYQFVFSVSDEIYYADLIFPPIGRWEAFLEIDYGEEQFDALSFDLVALSGGIISDIEGVRLSGVEIALLQMPANILPYLGIYGESNPIVTNENGLYGWVVPNGAYALRVRKDGFYERLTPIFQIENNLVNLDVTLIPRPPLLIEVIDPDASIDENAIRITKNLIAKSQALLRVTKVKARDLVDNPRVEKSARNIIAPAVVGTVAISTIATSGVSFLWLLRFLFLQPILLLGRGKREKWGVVYNSLNKLPIDLAIVRLFDANNNRLVQSRVTDSRGRYAFVVDFGVYRLEVQKNNLIFPSVFLRAFKNDGDKLDIYHGEIIRVTEKNSLITANIPLDPAEEKNTPRRIIRAKIWRRLQFSLSWFGFFVTAISLYISPVWYMWILLAAHLFFLLVFKRLHQPPRAKGWGIVYDAAVNTPVARVVARLFDAQFNKLVATEITDSKGRYHFLAGENNYYVTYEHPRYETTKINFDAALTKTAGAIISDIKIKQKTQ